MAENRRGKGRRYFFTLAQMVLLGTAFTLTCVVVFFLGILIGKEIEARKVIKPEEPLVKIPIKPALPGATSAAPKEELTFYETLTKAPPSSPGVEQNGKARDEKHGAAPLKRDPPKEAKRESSRAAVAATRPTAEKGPEAASLSPTAGTPTAENGERKENGRVWTVQVNAYPDERSARQLVDRLKNKGYNAQIAETRNKGKVWYRVRVGSYRSREEADRVLEDLKNKEKFDKAFATSRQ